MISATARSYAQALADVVFDDGRPAEAAQELAAFAQLMPAGSELSAALLSPAVSFSSKRGVIEEVAKRLGTSPLVMNLLLALTRNGRLSILDAVVQAYQEEVDRRNGVERVQVTSPRTLSDGIKKRLESEAVRLVGGEARFEYRTDESLIAGLHLRVGSTVYDGSVRTQLQEIERRLSS